MQRRCSLTSVRRTRWRSLPIWLLIRSSNTMMPSRRIINHWIRTTRRSRGVAQDRSFVMISTRCCRRWGSWRTSSKRYMLPLAVTRNSLRRIPNQRPIGSTCRPFASRHVLRTRSFWTWSIASRSKLRATTNGKWVATSSRRRRALQNLKSASFQAC